MSRRVTVLNNKGGVGKTLVAVALAEAAAKRGQRVLFVDMDPQANGTRRLGVRPEDAGWNTLTACLRPGVQKGAAKAYVLRHGWADSALSIDVLAADLDLEDRALEGGLAGASARLKKALFGVDDDYDLTIIDCPPSIKGHLTMMAISALDGQGDAVLVPTEPEADAISGARRVVDYVRMYRDDLGVANVFLAGLIVNKVRSSTVLHQLRQTELSTLIEGVPVLLSLPQRTRIAEVQDAARPLSSELDLAPIMAEFDLLAIRLLGDKP